MYCALGPYHLGGKGKSPGARLLLPGRDSASFLQSQDLDSAPNAPLS